MQKTPLGCNLCICCWKTIRRHCRLMYFLHCGSYQPLAIHLSSYRPAWYIVSFSFLVQRIAWELLICRRMFCHFFSVEVYLSTLMFTFIILGWQSPSSFLDDMLKVNLISDTAKKLLCRITNYKHKVICDIYCIAASFSDQVENAMVVTSAMVVTRGEGGKRHQYWVPPQKKALVIT